MKSKEVLEIGLCESPDITFVITFPLLFGCDRDWGRIQMWRSYLKMIPDVHKICFRLDV